MRVKTGVTRRRRHKKVLKATKGYRMARGKRYKAAHEAFLHAGQHAYVGRRLRKRDFRRLWISRISAGLMNMENGPSYSVFMNLLKQKNIVINRKMLSEMVTNDIEGFTSLVNQVYGK